MSRSARAFPAALRRILLLGLLLLPSPAAVPFSFGDPPPLHFPDGLDWLNVSRPLTSGDLEGKIVILDFWTYGCINCIHVAEELRGLEEKFGNELAIIGVHSPKFDNEKNLEALRSILVRLDRRHAIVSDPDWQLMETYRIRAWPSLAVFTPTGQWLGKATGEGNAERLEQAVERLLELYEKEINRDPLPIDLEKDRFDRSLLAAPGKIAVSPDGSRIAVSDTLHNRILLADPAGLITGIVGDGRAGHRDGEADQARFKAPQGLVFGDGFLFVADAGNHAVRSIELGSGRVGTLAGTGRIGTGIRSIGVQDALQLDLRSPWDLALKGDRLYIAMAGSHQIWRLGLKDGRIGPYAGSRREGIDTGPLQAASFSQPSGLSLLDGDLYVADAEASAIRRIRVQAGLVENLVGKGLFDFGDRDGDLADAQLQHVAGIAALGPGKLVIADSYNHKVKLLDLDQGTVTTLLGTGHPGKRLGTLAETQLNEPGGLTVLGDLILVADTNNHRILAFSRTPERVSEWPLRKAP